MRKSSAAMSWEGSSRCLITLRGSFPMRALTLFRLKERRPGLYRYQRFSTSMYFQKPRREVERLDKELSPRRPQDWPSAATSTILQKQGTLVLELPQIGRRLSLVRRARDAR